MRKKILIVSTFPPRKCGIGTYAYSQARYYKKLGHQVITLGLGRDSSSYRKLHFNKDGIRNLIPWLLSQRYDEVHLHFVDGFFNFEKDKIQKLALFRIFSIISTKFIIVVHEILPKIRANSTRLLALSFADEFEVHTEKEKKILQDIYTFANQWEVPFVDKRVFISFLKYKIPKISVVEHDRYFLPYFDGTKEMARKYLGLYSDKKIVVALGFIQKHKGFDRVVDAFVLGDISNDIEFYIVGSRREEASDIVEYYIELEQYVDKSGKSIKLVNKFLSDEEFDIWIKAADALILPYREIWSSGVGARAKLLGCPVIASNLPTLIEQLKGQEHYIFSDELDLAEIIKNLPRKVDIEKNSIAIMNYQDNNIKKKSILVVAPVLTNKFIGGAEVVIKDFVEILCSSGDYDITIVSTKSNSISNFNNEEISTNPKDYGFNSNVTIKRFTTLTFMKIFHKKVHSVYTHSSNYFINELWKYSGLTGLGMINYVKNNAKKFDAVYIPHYLYPISHRVIKSVDNNIVHPFIHDEKALDNINNKKFFQWVKLLMVNSEAEKTILDKHNIPVFCDIEEIGNRVRNSLVDFDGEYENIVLNKFNLIKKKYIFYVGRISKMKNVDDLIHWHSQMLNNTILDIELVIAGKGDVLSVAGLQQLPIGIRDIGFISEYEKKVLMKNALAVAQLSILESFSLVVVESWLLKTPVIINPKCLPIKYNFIKSQGAGKLAEDVSGYIQAVESLIFLDDDRFKELGENGFKFVNQNFVSGVFEGRLIKCFNKVAEGRI